MASGRAKKRPWGCFITLILFVGAAAFLIINYYLSNYTLKRENTTLAFENLPENFDGMTIAHLSDIHTWSWGDGNKDLLEMLEKANPNIIAITGDLLHLGEGAAWDLDLCEKLAEIAPTYFVTGNHEWQDSAFNTLRRPLAEAGVVILDNKYVTLESGDQQIILAGREDPNGPNYSGMFSDMINGVNSSYDNPFIIALSHRNEPDLYESIRLDLVLCGHGHGGMIRLPFTDGPISPRRELWPEYTNGLYILDNGNAMLVSRGMDGPTSGPRLFNRPHVTILTLRAK